MAPIVHAHAILMLGWLVLYTTQTGLVSSGNVALHRTLGSGAIVLAGAVWLSMIVMTVGSFRRFDPAEMGFLTQILLIQIGSALAYGLFVTWALLARRDAGWHRRLMTFGALVLVQAALDRMHWLPDEGLPMFWHHAIRLYVLMVPLVVYDLVRLKRLHPATQAGIAIIVLMHALVSVFWHDEAWNRLAMEAWVWIRGF